METIKTNTWLPLFSGFYGTIWEADNDIDREIEYINELREEKGLNPIDFDNCEFDYKQYEMDTVKGIAKYLEREYLKAFVTSIQIEKVVSPRFYNFSNDSADIIVELSSENIKSIESYLIEHKKAFGEYLKAKYTSCSGFISHYANTVEGFIEGDLMYCLRHQHKCGSILEFIAENEYVLNGNGESLELCMYYDIERNISCINFDELTTKEFEESNERL